MVIIVICPVSVIFMCSFGVQAFTFYWFWWQVLWLQRWWLKYVCTEKWRFMSGKCCHYCFVKSLTVLYFKFTDFVIFFNPKKFFLKSCILSSPGHVKPWHQVSSEIVCLASYILNPWIYPAKLNEVCLNKNKHLSPFFRKIFQIFSSNPWT